MNKDLLGTWVTDPNDLSTRNNYGSVKIEFKDDGKMIYTIIEGDSENIIILTYEVDGNFIITDQNSAPQQERTEYRIIDVTLELNFDGIKSKYVKV